MLEQLRYFTKSTIFYPHLVNYHAFFHKNRIILYQISYFSCTFGKLSVSLHTINEKGTQIDMLIDRDDRTINLCEIKYSQGEYEISEAYNKVLLEKLSIFQQATKTKKGVSLLMITSYGLKRNQWSNSIHIQLTMDDLFAF